MQNQVSTGNGKGTNGTGASKSPGTTIVAKAGPPLTKKVEPTPGTTSRPDEGPRVLNSGPFLNREVTIYAPAGSFLSQVYNDSTTSKEQFVAEVKGTLLDATFDPVTGAPQWGLIQYRQRGARLYENRDLIPLAGCSISILVERQIEEEPADPVKK